MRRLVTLVCGINPEQTAFAFIKIWKVLPVAFLLVLSCSDDEKVNKPLIAVVEHSDGIDRIILDGTSSQSKEKDLTFAWQSSDPDFVIEQKNYSKAFFKILPGNKERSVDVTLKVTHQKQTDEVSITIPVPVLTQVRSYGIGKNLTKEVDNSALYAWYLDQGNSGQFSFINCGPASVTMAATWASKNFNKSIEDARNTYRATGGWWFTSDIINYLNLHNVTNWVTPLTSTQVLKEELNNKNIIILCLDMYYVAQGTDPEYRVNKFYLTQNTGWGHFIVIKGYKEVDGKTFFEAYDPYSLNSRYSDLSPRGMNRYYDDISLDLATQLWWDYAIIVSKEMSSGGRKGVDINNILHQSGQ